VSTKDKKASIRTAVNERMRRRERAEALTARLLSDGNKTFANGFTTTAMMRGNVKGFVPTGIAPLDVLLSGKAGGGFAMGRFSELMGEADVGKTTIGCYLIRAVQAMGGVGVVIDTEKTLTERRLVELGVETRQVVAVEDTILESICDRILFMLEKIKDQPAVIFWDTIAATRSNRTKGRKVGESGGLAVHAQVLADAFRRITDPLADSRVALVMCNQRKQGGIGDLFVNARKRDAALGGDAPKFAASQRMKLSFVNHGKVKQAKQAGQNFIVRAEMQKNKIAPSRLQVMSVIDVSGAVSQFNAAASYVETMTKWGEMRAGRVVYSDKDSGKKYSRERFEGAYSGDRVFRLRADARLVDAYHRLNLREAEEGEDE